MGTSRSWTNVNDRLPDDPLGQFGIRNEDLLRCLQWRTIDSPSSRHRMHDPDSATRKWIWSDTVAHQPLVSMADSSTRAPAGCSADQAWLTDEACALSCRTAGFRFPPEVIVVPVRWFMRHWSSYRDVEELLAERAVKVDHVTVYRWVQR
jgi:hypothetical protein